MPEETTPPAPPVFTAGSLKGTRADVTNKIGQSGLRESHKAMLIDEIQQLPMDVDLIKLDFHRSPYGKGATACWTLNEL